jgi:hypothetical protein
VGAVGAAAEELRVLLHGSDELRGGAAGSRSRARPRPWAGCDVGTPGLLPRSLRFGGCQVGGKGCAAALPADAELAGRRQPRAYGRRAARGGAAVFSGLRRLRAGSQIRRSGRVSGTARRRPARASTCARGEATPGSRGGMFAPMKPRDVVVGGGPLWGAARWVGGWGLWAMIAPANGGAGGTRETSASLRRSVQRLD